MMNRIKIILFLGLTALLASGCINVASLQTAQTLDPGQSELTVGGGLYVDAETGDSAPAATFQYRRGIVENFDVGARATILGTAGIDGKYRFVDADGFALAAGLSVGYLSFSVGSGEAEASTTFIDTMVPLFASYDINEYFAVYLSPKYVLRTTLPSEGDTDFSNNLGGTGGIKIGDGFGVYLEGSALQPLEENADLITQADAALFFKF